MTLLKLISEMYIKWESSSKEDKIHLEEEDLFTKVYIEREKTGSIIGKHGNNIQRVQKIANTHLDPYSDSMSVIKVESKDNESLQDAVNILQGRIG